MPGTSPTVTVPITLERLPTASVTVLADNICGDGPVLGEWGLSFLIHAGTHRILLDTGAGLVMRSNARALHVDVSTIESLVISHGHYDHTGGIDALLGHNRGLRVFLHPRAFATQFWKTGDGVEPFQMSPSRPALLQRVREIVDTTGPTFVTPAVITTGEIPRVTDFEDTGVTGEAFVDASMTVPDPVVDDQAVVFRVPQGVVVLLGCGHSGIINTLWHVRRLIGVDRIHAVMGGSHLIAADAHRMERTIAELKALRLDRLLLSHCTGIEAFAELAHAFPGQCSWPRSGSVVRFGTP